MYLQDGAEQVWILYRNTQSILVVTHEGTKEARLGEMVEFGGVTVKLDEIFKPDPA